MAGKRLLLNGLFAQQKVLCFHLGVKALVIRNIGNIDPFFANASIAAVSKAAR